MVTKESCSLYFHVPFCTKKCDYCHFYVIPDKESWKKEYMTGLQLEWLRQSPLLEKRPISSIYFGGGTPSLLGPERIAFILEWIKDSFPFQALYPEITLEANPENMTRSLMEGYASAGINRVSIGIQTFDDNLLQTLSRQHHAKKGIDAIYLTKEAGIQNISIDLMYDLPGQDLNSWKETLNQAVQLPITHLSLYNLTFEPQTVFFKKRNLLQQSVPSPDISLAMYKQAIETLQGNDFSHYEISAFARKGLKSIHNLGYWTARPFLGFGPSAFSYWDGKRFKNINNLSHYCQALEKENSPIDFQEELPPAAKLKELFVVQLRLTEGIDLLEFQTTHGNLDKETLEILEKLADQGFIQFSSDRATLTDRGILFYDTIASDLI